LIESNKQTAAPTRLSFEEAAHHYGKLALRERLGPSVSDTELGEMISKVLAQLPGADRLPRAA
jgi:hypothetical protein